MSTLMTQRDEAVGARLPMSSTMRSLLPVLFLLGAELALSLPAKAAPMIIPNLGCVTMFNRSASLAMFSAGTPSLALMLPIQRLRQRVKVFDSDFHTVWLLDPSRQAEKMASDMQPNCLVAVKDDGKLTDIMVYTMAEQHTETARSSD